MGFNINQVQYVNGVDNSNFRRTSLNIVNYNPLL